jgi:single-strand DNA-binding protein
MSGVNKVILIGHLGKDPEVRHLEGGTTLVNFPLATSESYIKDGKKIEQTEWHNIVMWRGLADVAAKYLHKGSLVYIEGKIRSRHYETKEGNKRYITEIIAESFNMLGKRNEGDANNSDQPANNQPTSSKSEGQFVDYKEGGSDDLPF